MQERQDREQHANPEPAEQTTSNTNVPCIETVPDEEEDSLFATDSMVMDDQHDIASAIPVSRFLADQVLSSKNLVGK
jgi:hypothetical protein